MIVEQVHLIDIEQAAIGRGQHARLEMPLALLDRLFDVERTHHAIFGGRDRQIDKGGRPDMGWDLRGPVEAFFTFCAPGGWFIRIAAEAAIVNNFHTGQ